MEVSEPEVIYRRYKPSIQNEASIVFAAQEGISAYIYDDVTTLLDNKDYLAEVVDLTPKTIAKYQRHNVKFSPMRSELLLKLVALSQSGNEVFGSKDSFLNWLKKPAFGIDNRTPLSLIKTSDGIDLIIDELDRIKYGDTA